MNLEKKIYKTPGEKSTSPASDRDWYLKHRKNSQKLNSYTLKAEQIIQL